MAVGRRVHRAGSIGSGVRGSEMATTSERRPPRAVSDAEAAPLGHAVRTVSAGTLASRVGGLARDLVLARVFGASAIASALNAGLAFPNLFRRLFGEGALAAAFVPEYAQAARADPVQAARLASLTLALLLLGTCGLTVLLELALLAVLALLPHEPDRVLSLRLIMIVLPFMPLVCAAAILGAMLQVHGRFGPAATGPVLLNLFILLPAGAGLLIPAPARPTLEALAYAVGVATVASGLVQCAWFARLLHRETGWTWTVRPGRSSAEAMAAVGQRVRRMLRRFVPVLVGMGTLQINTFLDMVLAMWPIWVGPTLLGLPYPMDERSNSILAFTQRLYQFPLGVFGIAVATAAFPMLARHAGDGAQFLATLRRGLRLSLFIGIPASTGLVLVRHDLVGTLYGGRGGFDAEALARCADVLAGFAPAVWAYSLNHVLTRASYAVGDTHTPMRIAVGMVGLNVMLNLMLIWPMREAGLAWSTAICAGVQCGLLMRHARTLAGQPLTDASTRRAVARILLAGAILAAGVLAYQQAIGSPGSWAEQALRLGGACLGGALLYAMAARVLGLAELRWLLWPQRPAGG